MQDNHKGVKYGVATATDDVLAKSLVLAALNNRSVPYDLAAMISEAAARLSQDGWSEGIREWQVENSMVGAILEATR